MVKKLKPTRKQTRKPAHKPSLLQQTEQLDTPQPATPQPATYIHSSANLAATWKSAVPSDSFVVPSKRLKIYFASKLHHSTLAKALSVEWQEFDWTARWPSLVGKVSKSDTQSKIFWLQDEEDVSKADAVLVYAELNDILRGALVEAGMGIALGKKVIVVGYTPSYGTWQHHPSVSWAYSLEEARKLLRLMAV